jgi:hypothetical protein
MTELPAPIATDADTARGHAGTCALCAHTINRGSRYALLVPSGKAAHLVCIGAAAARTARTRVPVIR